MIDERQPQDSTSFPLPKEEHNQPANEKVNPNGIRYKHNTQMGTYFFAKVSHNKEITNLHLEILHYITTIFLQLTVDQDKAYSNDLALVLLQLTSHLDLFFCFHFFLMLIFILLAYLNFCMFDILYFSNLYKQ